MIEIILTQIEEAKDQDQDQKEDLQEDNIPLKNIQTIQVLTPNKLQVIEEIFITPTAVRNITAAITKDNQDQEVLTILQKDFYLFVLVRSFPQLIYLKKQL